MDVQVLFSHLHQQGSKDAASVLLLIATVFLPLACFRLLLRDLRTFKPAASTCSKKIQPPHSFLTLLRHGFSLRRLRDSAVTSTILSFRPWGWNIGHNIMYTPSQLRIFANTRPPTIDFNTIKWRFFRDVFGIPSEYQGAYMAASDELDACVRKYLMQEPWMNEMIRKAIANTALNVEALVALPGAASEVETARWELHASPKHFAGSTKGSVACEVSLFPLLTNFLGSMTLPAMFGETFVAQSPTAVEDIEMLDDNLGMLALGLPRWLPIPSLRNTFRVRDRVLDNLERLYASLDTVAEGRNLDPKWSKLDDVSRLIRGFDQSWKKAGLSVRARAGAGLSMAWALTINANSAFFWMMLRVHATAGLADKIREQTQAFFPPPSTDDAKAAPPPEDISGADDLGRRCPLLKACYLETIRLDGEIRSIRKVQREHSIPTSDDSGAEPSHRLRSGDYIHALHHLHHSDPKYFPNPSAFHPERFLTVTRDGNGNEGTRVDQRTLRPYGAGVSMCKGRFIAERTVLYAAAAFLHSWDMQPPKGEGWTIPGYVSAAGVCKPKRDVRVLLSRRRRNGGD